MSADQMLSVVFSAGASMSIVATVLLLGIHLSRSRSLPLRERAQPVLVRVSQPRVKPRR